MNNYEFDKYAGAIALALFLIVFCYYVGNLFYYPEIPVKKRGYEIEIKNNDDSIKADEMEEEPDLQTLFSVVNYELGEKTFKKCAVCHTVEQGGANKIGPNLWSIVGSEVASRSSFVYSKAMSAKGFAKDHWSFDELMKYLKSPKKHVPGTKMAFAGIKDVHERASLIEFLRLHSNAPIKKP